MTVTYEDVAAAHERIKTQARRTPVMTSGTIDALTGASVFFKCENLQRMGAFKFRGAFNALSQLSADERRRGVLAFSSGNHAQAVALSGKLLGIKTLIVMPAVLVTVRRAAATSTAMGAMEGSISRVKADQPRGEDAAQEDDPLALEGSERHGRDQQRDDNCGRAGSQVRHRRRGNAGHLHQ